MATPLAAALEKLGLSDADFGSKCRPKIHRTLIWCYRTGLKQPRVDKAVVVLSALRDLGVELKPDDLVRRKPRRKNRAA